MYAYINMYNKLTSRVRALKSTSGLLIPGSPRLHNFNVRVPERGSLGTRLRQTWTSGHSLVPSLSMCEK